MAIYVIHNYIHMYNKFIYYLDNNSKQITGNFNAADGDVIIY